LRFMLGSGCQRPCSWRLSILFLRFREWFRWFKIDHWAKELSILFLRFIKLMALLMAPKPPSFNPLFEILNRMCIDLHEDDQFFQFSFWDSMPYTGFGPCMLNALSILFLRFTFSMIITLIKFQLILSILFLRFAVTGMLHQLGIQCTFQFSFWDSRPGTWRWLRIASLPNFQFSFWDSWGRLLRHEGSCCCAFNSLFEIHRRRYERAISL